MVWSAAIVISSLPCRFQYSLPMEFHAAIDLEVPLFGFPFGLFTQKKHGRRGRKSVGMGAAFRSPATWFWTCTCASLYYKCLVDCCNVVGSQWLRAHSTHATQKRPNCPSGRCPGHLNKAIRHWSNASWFNVYYMLYTRLSITAHHDLCWDAGKHACYCHFFFNFFYLKFLICFKSTLELRYLEKASHSKQQY